MAPSPDDSDLLDSGSAQLTREAFPLEVTLVEAYIELCRRAFNLLKGSITLNEQQKLSFDQLKVTATSLEAGYLLGLRGYYQPALASCRMLLEHLATYLYFAKHPHQAKKALDEDWQPPIADGFLAHPNERVGHELGRMYDFLSRASHPRSLSRSLGSVDGRARLNTFDVVAARLTLGYLIELASRLIFPLAAHVKRVSLGANDWAAYAVEVNELSMAWLTSQTI